jgi:N-acetylneuraminate lyase
MTLILQREQCSGIFAALLTPLTASETLDATGCERLIHALLNEGQAGLYLTGSTGEEFAIDDSVRTAVYTLAGRVVRERAKGESLIAHVGGVPSRRAYQLARAAADAGCHAIAALPPHGGRYSFEELTAYYAGLAQCTPLPLFVYHIPELTGYDFSREQLSQWLRLPNVLGMKFTSSDLFRMERLIALHPDKALFHGADQLLMHGIGLGAMGAIGSTYNLLGPLAIKICKAVRRSDLAAAVRGQRALNQFIEVLFAAGGLRALKALTASHHDWASDRSPLPGATPSVESLGTLRQSFESAMATARDMP